MPHVASWKFCQIFSSFLIFCHYFTWLKAREICCKIWETWKIFPMRHSAPYNSNYLFNVLLESVNLLTKDNSQNWIKLTDNINWLWKLRQYGIIFLASMKTSRTRTQRNRQNRNHIRNWKKRKTSHVWRSAKTCSELS